jgi:hypothetical protein
VEIKLFIIELAYLEDVLLITLALLLYLQKPISFDGVKKLIFTIGIQNMFIHSLIKFLKK